MRTITGAASLQLSLVIPTYGRATLLHAALESLRHQTLPRDEFEVVVIDDGSPDNTREVCQLLSESLPLRYFRIQHSGVSAAKNLGIFTARAPIILFFDDDDLATPTLLSEHVATHERYTDQNLAVLGYTGWATGIRVTPLMHFVTEIGQQLFAYRDLADGAVLDFTYFWGGRTSCKRSLLVQWGIFDPLFRGPEHDIELAYRLTRAGLQVIFNGRAVSGMNRPVDLPTFCHWVEHKGRARQLLSRVHRSSLIDEYCRIQEASAVWQRLKWAYRPQVRRAQALEAQLTGDPSVDRDAVSELWLLYQSCFDALNAKGIVEVSDPTDIRAFAAADRWR